MGRDVLFYIGLVLGLLPVPLLVAAIFMLPG